VPLVGQVYGTERATLIQGDCLEVLPKLESGSIDAVVTDPPWKDYQTGRYDATKWHAPVGYLKPEMYASELFRVLRSNTACLLWCGWECFERHADALRQVGFTIKNCVVWAKPNHTAGDLAGNFGYQHEMAVFAVKGRWRRHGKRDTNLWQESHLFSRARREHPTEKPIGLMRRSVDNCCPPGGIVIDPFMGSGTTGLACLETGCKFLGIEIDPTYCAIAKERIAKAELACVKQKET
jgi:DNA modification methylase